MLNKQIYVFNENVFLKNRLISFEKSSDTKSWLEQKTSNRVNKPIRNIKGAKSSRVDGNDISMKYADSPEQSVSDQWNDDKTKSLTISTNSRSGKSCNLLGIVVDDSFNAKHSHMRVE